MADETTHDDAGMADGANSTTAFSPDGRDEPVSPLERSELASAPSRGPRRGPYRRLRRWARHTPNGEIAMTMMATGAALILLAVAIVLIFV